MKKIQLPYYLQKKAVLSSILFYLFVLFAIIAVINPKWGMGYAAAEYRRGLDAVFAIDVSRSMDVRDVQIGGNRVSRLNRGLALAKEAASAVPGGRFASAIGRGRGYLSVPLTFDNEAAISFLENLNTQAMTGRSTNLQSLIEAAAGAFQTASAARKAIVLISDGEAHLGVLRNALNQCIRDGIVIIAVGIGSDEGAQVPGITEDPIPVSQRDSAALRMAAERTGGVYIDGNRDDAASALKNQLLSLAQDLPHINTEKKTEPKQHRGLFVIFAVISYGASKFVSRSFFKKTERLQSAVSIILLVLFLSSCTEDKLLLLRANYLYSRGRYEEAEISYTKALEHEVAAPYAEYGLGLTHYSTDNSGSALNHYLNSMRKLPNNRQTVASHDEHRELRYRNTYNMGIIMFDQGLYETAAVYFKEALKIDPLKIDAKRNLEISLMSVIKDTSRKQQSETNNETKEVMFEYVRQQEQSYWRSGEWQMEENFTGPDY